MPLASIVTGAVGVPILALSSVARARIEMVPPDGAVNEYVHVPRPVARRQVVPPSVETSTPPTLPPTSVAAPVTTTLLPGATDEPWVGDVIVAVARVLSVDLEADTSPAPSVDGCTPMSANRLTVACCAATSAGDEPRSCELSSAHAHCTVPAPKTSAPLDAR